MELTTTASHPWLSLPLLRSLTHIATAVGVLAWYYERRMDQRRDALTPNADDLIMFEDEVTFDSPVEDLRNRYRATRHEHRLRDEQCRHRNETPAWARRSTPKYAPGWCHKAARSENPLPSHLTYTTSHPHQLLPSARSPTPKSPSPSPSSSHAHTPSAGTFSKPPPTPKHHPHPHALHQPRTCVPKPTEQGTVPLGARAKSKNGPQ